MEECELCHKKITFWEWYGNGHWCRDCHSKFFTFRAKEKEKTLNWWRKKLLEPKAK